MLTAISYNEWWMGKKESLWTVGNSLLGLHSYHVCNGEPPDKEVTFLKAKNTSHANQENSPLLRFNVDVKFWTYSIARVYLNRKTRIKRAKNRMQLRIKIKELLEPAHSCYGLALHLFLGLDEYRYSWIRFMWTFNIFGINFLLFLGSCVIRKLMHSSWWKLERWAEVIRQTVSFLLVCVCLWGRFLMQANNNIRHICENWCVHSWKLKIYQVEGTVLVSVRIFVNKANTYQSKRWNVWTTCKAVNFFSNIARVKYTMVASHLNLHLLSW